MKKRVECPLSNSSELEDLQILVTSVLYGGNDLQIRYEWDFVGRGRKRNLESSGANFWLSISTYGRKAESEGDKRSAAKWKSPSGARLGFKMFQPPTLILSTPLESNTRLGYGGTSIREPSTKLLMATMHNEPSAYRRGHPLFLKDEQYRTKALPPDVLHGRNRCIARWSREKIMYGVQQKGVCKCRRCREG